MKLVNVVKYDQVVSKVVWEGDVGYYRSATYTLDEVGMYLHREMILVPLDGEVKIVSNYVYHTDLNDMESSVVESFSFVDSHDSVDDLETAKDTIREYDFFEDEGFEG